MTWTWRLEAADGSELENSPSAAQPNHSDAETWLGEQWRALAEAGVAQVTLLDAGKVVYGPMPLSEE